MRCFLPATDRPCTEMCAAHDGKGCMLLAVARTLEDLLLQKGRRRAPYPYPEPPEVGR